MINHLQAQLEQYQDSVSIPIKRLLIIRDEPLKAANVN
jgi:hypothetical protein